MTREILPIGFIFFFLYGYVAEVCAQTHAADGGYITDWLLLTTATSRSQRRGCPALIYRSAEQSVTEVRLEGMPLGSLIGGEYQHATFKLQPGDTVLLMSDGLPERLNADDNMLDYPKTEALFGVGKNTPAEIIPYLFKAGEAWANGRPQDDDVTFVVMKVK